MDFTMVIPVLIAFVLSVAAGPVVIPVLRRLKMDQTEREDGVKSHLKKAGTPTMGGVMILFAIGHFADLCKRVSEGDSGTFCNDWIRTGRVPG